jgi:hypothetical protein
VDGSGSNSLEAEKFYGYAVTFYNHNDAIESANFPAAARVTAETTVANKTINLSSIEVCSDQQVTRRKIYRTAAQDTEAGAENAQLYYLDTINDNTTTTYQDDGDVTLSSTILPSEDWDEPGQYAYVLGDAGRLWVADKDDSYTDYSTFDATGAPVLDGFPSGNSLQIEPDDGDIITALARIPGGLNQRAVFKRNATYIIHGDTASTMQIQRHMPGCAAPFAVAEVNLEGGNDLLFFFGADKQIWALGAGAPQLVSLPVKPLLDDIPASRFDQLQAVGYANKYLLAYPTGDNENDRLLVYDASQKYWTTYDLPVNWLSWWNGEESTDADKNRLVFANSGTSYVEYLFTDSVGDEIYEDNSTPITASWLSNTLYLPYESIITGVYIYDVTESTYTVRVDKVDERGVRTGREHPGFAPSRRNNYRQGCFERGRGFQIYFETESTPSIVERIEIEWRRV